MKTLDVYERTTLEQLQALISTIAEKCPALASRAERAGAIILHGKLHQLDATRFECVSADDGKLYVVDLAGECPCLDYQKRGVLDPKGNRTCKHVLAAVLFNKLVTRGGGTPSPRPARLAHFRPSVTRRLTRKAA